MATVFSTVLNNRQENVLAAAAAGQNPGVREIVETQLFTEGATQAFLVGSLMMLGASLIVWIFLDVKHQELATDGPEGAVHLG